MFLLYLLCSQLSDALQCLGVAGGGKDLIKLELECLALAEGPATRGKKSRAIKKDNPKKTPKSACAHATAIHQHCKVTLTVQFLKFLKIKFKNLQQLRADQSCVVT